MSKILDVIPNDDYTLSIEFDDGNKIIFDMKPYIKTLVYSPLQDLTRFKDIKIEEKAVYWRTSEDKQSTISLRLTIDNMLFAIRE